MYGKYIAFSHPYGKFDEYEMNLFVQSAQNANANMAFCGAIRLFDDGAYTKSYFTDVTQSMSGSEAVELMRNEKWLIPRLFGTLIQSALLKGIPRSEGEDEITYMLRLTNKSDKVLIYGGYAVAIQAKYDISSVHCIDSNWVSSKNGKHVFPPIRPEIPPTGKKYRAFIIGVPEHGNLGDQAIIYAMKSFSRHVLKNIEIIEISDSVILQDPQWFRDMVSENDIILLPGGGNFGDLYILPRKVRERVLTAFTRNKICIFPQSIYYEIGYPSQSEVCLLNGVPNLTLCLRERASYEIARKHFAGQKSLICPDIVLSLRPKLPRRERNGLIIIARTDKESEITFDALCDVKKMLNRYFKDVITLDTVIRHNAVDRTGEVMKFLRLLRGAEIVITDRLHGAIFAAITETPCVVLSNNYHKIKSSYEWLNRLGYIVLCDNIGELLDCVKRVCDVKSRYFDYEGYQKLFEPLAEVLRDEGK
jgi:pyruvyl transferase EpsI